MSNLSKQKTITKILKLYQDKNYVKTKTEALKLLSKNVKNTAVYNILGLIYTSEYDFINAKLMYEKAIKIDNKTPQLYLNLGNVYLEEENYTKAEALYLKSIDLGASTYNAFFNLAKVYKFTKNKEAAQEMFYKALSINPNHSDLRFEYAQLCLQNKLYLEGFDYYRSRYDVTKSNKQTSLIPESNLLTIDLDINNKIILLTHEQGLGDVLQFARYIPMFENLGAKVYVQAKKMIYSLLQASYPNTNFLHENEMVEFDYYLPIMEAAYFFKTQYSTIPYQDKYLKVNKNDSDAISDKYFKDVNKKKIGIVWRSNINKSDTEKAKVNRAKRNCKLEDFLDFFDKTSVQLYSLQVDTTEQERQLLSAKQILSLGDNFVEVYDNALVIDNLDMLIGIETLSVVIAGAMGKETALLLGENSGWMWGNKDIDTNWHSSIQIFRKDKEWQEVIKEISAISGLFLNNKIGERKINIAIRYHQSGDLMKAEQLYREVLIDEPNNADAYHYLGVIAFSAGHVKQSIGLIKEALRINPHLDEAYNNLNSIVQSLSDNKKESL